MKLYLPHPCKCGCGRIVTTTRRYHPDCYTPAIALAISRASGAKGGRNGFGDAKRRGTRGRAA